MRGDAGLSARLLLRGSGLAGLTIAAGGALAAFAVTRPWFHAMAEVGMLGTRQARAVDSLAGTQTILGWVALAVGLGAIVLGLLCALDRPPAPTRRLLLLGAGLLLLVAAYAWLGPGPELDRVAGTEGDQLAALAGRLPSGLELELGVRPAIGPVLAALGGLLVVGGTLAAREL